MWVQNIYLGKRKEATQHEKRQLSIFFNSPQNVSMFIFWNGIEADRRGEGRDGRRKKEKEKEEEREKRRKRGWSKTYPIATECEIKHHVHILEVVVGTISSQ